MFSQPALGVQRCHAPCARRSDRLAIVIICHISGGEYSWHTCICAERLRPFQVAFVVHVKFAFEELKLVVEPGGAVALAALLKHGKEWSGETIAVILSGGNIDTEVLEAALHS